MDNNVDAIEREIILKYNDYRSYNSDNDVLLSLRKDIINKQVLANQEELFPDIIAFNDALREALREMYDRAHRIYAASDALLVPSLFEPCGLTQLIAMRYGTLPIVRETGGLKDTVEPYNMYEDSGNGFTFDGYDAGLLLDAVNRAKTLYFEYRDSFDKMVVRDMQKDVSWEKSAAQYRDLYLRLKP